MTTNLDGLTSSCAEGTVQELDEAYARLEPLSQSRRAVLALSILGAMLAFSWLVRERLRPGPTSRALVRARIVALVAIPAALASSLAVILVPRTWLTRTDPAHLLAEGGWTRGDGPFLGGPSVVTEESIVAYDQRGRVRVSDRAGGRTRFTLRLTDHVSDLFSEESGYSRRRSKCPHPTTLTTKEEAVYIITYGSRGAVLDTRTGMLREVAEVPLRVEFHRWYCVDGVDRDSLLYPPEGLLETP